MQREATKEQSDTSSWVIEYADTRLIILGSRMNSEGRFQPANRDCCQ